MEKTEEEDRHGIRSETGRHQGLGETRGSRKSRPRAA